MRCAKNLINSITPPMNDKINPQTFSVLGVNIHIGTTSNEKEISHGTASRQTHQTHFALGLLASSIGYARILMQLFRAAILNVRAMLMVGMMEQNFVQAAPIKDFATF
jgi:hypothetical protein